MDLDSAIARLQHNRTAIAGLFSGVDERQARWKPSADDWSLLEVVIHLHDEEREDFRVRLDILLHHGNAPWPPIDPQGWVLERRYNERDPGMALADFISERERSLAWLRDLTSPDWSTCGTTPWGSTMAAGEMLHCWLAHDMLHLRQMVELHYAFIAESAAPGSIAYAGDW